MKENSMATASLPPPTEGTMADLITYLGDIPPERIRLRPAPGNATEEDVITVNERREGLCELIDGVLVEKPMGFYESRLALLLAHYLEEYLGKNDLGFLLGADGMVGVAPGQVRLPDVSFFFWRRFPNRTLPRGAILRMTPDLAVEILSPSNRPREMKRKLQELFAGGGQLAWHVDPEQRTVKVFTAVEQYTELDASQTLDGGTVLPGFSLPLAQWFTRAGQRA
jgi:Uma2 family endonuclease